MSPLRTAEAIAALAPSVFVGDVTIEGSESDPAEPDWVQATTGPWEDA